MPLGSIGSDEEPRSRKPQRGFPFVSSGSAGGYLSNLPPGIADLSRTLSGHPRPCAEDPSHGESTRLSFRAAAQRIRQMRVLRCPTRRLSARFSPAEGWVLGTRPRMTSVARPGVHQRAHCTTRKSKASANVPGGGSRRGSVGDQSEGQVARCLWRPKRVVQRRWTSASGRGSASGKSCGAVGGALRQTMVIQ